MSFSSDIKKWSRKTQKKQALVFRGTSLSLFTKIARRTPVLSGRAIGNWQVELNAPANQILARTGLASSLSEAVSDISKAAIGDTIFITNHLPYILLLEDGDHSAKAPNGMVAITVAEYKAIVEEQARKARKLK